MTANLCYRVVGVIAWYDPSSVSQPPMRSVCACPAHAHRSRAISNPKTFRSTEGPARVASSVHTGCRPGGDPHSSLVHHPRPAHTVCWPGEQPDGPMALPLSRCAVLQAAAAPARRKPPLRGRLDHLSVLPHLAVPACTLSTSQDDALLSASAAHHVRAAAGPCRRLEWLHPPPLPPPHMCSRGPLCILPTRLPPGSARPLRPRWWCRCCCSWWRRCGCRS